MAISKQLQLHVKVNRDRAFDKHWKCDGFNKFVLVVGDTTTKVDESIVYYTIERVFAYYNIRFQIL